MPNTQTLSVSASAFVSRSLTESDISETKNCGALVCATERGSWKRAYQLREDQFGEDQLGQEGQSLDLLAECGAEDHA